MAKNNNLTDFLTSLANKFRSVLGTSGTIDPQDFDDLVDSTYTKGYNDNPGIDVSDTTAAKSNVLTGKYFYTSAGVKTEGTMANNGSLGTTTLTKATSSKTIPAGYTSGGTVKISTTNLSEGNIKTGVTVVGVTGTFTSDGNVEEYDVIKDKIAYADGSKVTGKYACLGTGPQYNCDSSGCSTTALVVPCNFQPTAVAIVLNSATYTNNRIIAVWATSTAVVYHTKTSSGVTRTQVTSSISSYWSWNSSTNKVTIKSASSTYLWGANSYRVFIFK